MANTTVNTIANAKIAVQFPPNLLSDAQPLLSLLTTALSTALPTTPLVFALGDSGCCPDLVGARHLEANVLVQVGESCCTPFDGIPLVRASGR